MPNPIVSRPGLDTGQRRRVLSISVDEDVMMHTRIRYRFSLAHELGHHWIHDDLYQGVEIGSLGDWKSVLEDIGDQCRFFEFQANAFAGLVLVPPAALKARFTRRLEEDGLLPPLIDG